MKSLKHLPHYFTLMIVLVVGFLAFNTFSYSIAIQATIAAVVAGAYIIWGVAHHAFHDDLHLSVIIEYVIVAMLGLIMVLSILLQ